MAGFKKIGDFKMKQTLKQYQGFVQRVPVLLANETENHFKMGFTKGGGQTNASKSGWPERQFTRGEGKRNTLIGRGTLQRDILKRSVNFQRIVVGTSSLTNKYADIHNKGGNIRITAKSKRFFWAMYHKAKSKAEKEYWKNMALTKKAFFKMPQREYIGNSVTLEKKLEQIIDRELIKVWQ